MFPDLPPAAEGELGQTPFAHLAVYALDKRITGEIFLTEDPGAEKPVTHVIRFDNGVPSKIKVGDGFARLGDLLVEQGLVDPATLASALATVGSLLGDMLVLGGCVEPKALDETLNTQFERRIVRFYSLPPSTTFKYFDRAETIANSGGDPSRLDPFKLLWMGLSTHGDCSALMGPTLELLGSMPLTFHPRTNHHRFCFEGPAADVVDIITIEPTPLEELLSLETATPDLVRKVVYALMITRQLEVGKGGLPVGVEERPATVAKVQLRSTMQRRGVALDEPGDGERTPVRPITIRRGSAGSFEVLPREEDLGSRTEDEPTSTETPLGSAPSTPRASQPRHAPPPASSAGAPPPSQVPATAKSAPVMPKETTKTAETAEDKEEPSQQRFIADALRGMPLQALIDLAVEQIEEKDTRAALDVCKIAREADPQNTQVRAVAIWASSQRSGADLKVFTVELDEAIQDGDSAVLRHVRGLLRKRLGEDKGAVIDFKRAIELDASFERAKRELALLERASPDAPAPTGLLKRLFGR